MPSLWLYLQKLDPDVPEYFFGLIMGGFNLASMLASPFFGYWMDNRPMKEIFIFCMFVGVIGNTTYALAPNIYVVLLGRLISGVGVRRAVEWEEGRLWRSRRRRAMCTTAA